MKPGAPVVKGCAALQGVCMRCLMEELRLRSAVTPMARKMRRIDASQARNFACG